MANKLAIELYACTIIGHANVAMSTITNSSSPAIFQLCRVACLQYLGDFETIVDNFLFVYAWSRYFHSQTNTNHNPTWP